MSETGQSTSGTERTSIKRDCEECGTPIPAERPDDWDNECPNPHCPSRLQTDGGSDTNDNERKDPTEYPTAHAFRLTTEAHTKLCVVGNEIEDEEIQELEEEARAAVMELFDAMAEKRGLTEIQYEDVYLDTGPETWQSVEPATDRDGGSSDE